MSGSIGLRVPLETASGFNLPALIWLAEVPMPSKAMSTLPASRSCIIGPAPLYGTCTMSVPVRIL